MYPLIFEKCFNPIRHKHCKSAVIPTFCSLPLPRKNNFKSFSIAISPRLGHSRYNKEIILEWPSRSRMCEINSPPRIPRIPKRNRKTRIRTRFRNCREFISISGSPRFIICKRIYGLLSFPYRQRTKESIRGYHTSARLPATAKRNNYFSSSLPTKPRNHHEKREQMLISVLLLNWSCSVCEFFFIFLFPNRVVCACVKVVIQSLTLPHNSHLNWLEIILQTKRRKKRSAL